MAKIINWMMTCKKCWESKFIDEFDINKKNQIWLSVICKECKEEEINKYKINEEERLEIYKYLVNQFYNLDTIKHNMKILWEHYRFSDEDIFITLKNIWYDKKWLIMIFQKNYIEPCLQDDAFI